MNKIDTIRILVDWKCNLSCTYCCNEKERFRKDILPSYLHEIDFSKYSNVCISGGEPLMFMSRVKEVAKLAEGKFMILYTNGIFFTESIAKELEDAGIRAINVGLHYPVSFESIIDRVNKSTKGTNLQVRFHVWDKYAEMELPKKYTDAKFKFWSMDDCDRDNEERVVLQYDEQTAA